MKYESKETKKVYKQQCGFAVFAFLAELPNFVFSLIIAFTANSVLCWIDTLVSFGNTLHFAIVALITFKMMKDTSDKYNYGLERLEVFTSFICDLLICVVMLALLGSSVYGIVYPEGPTNDIGLFALLKVGNISFDVAYVINGLKVKKTKNSRLAETELKAYIMGLTHDVIVGVTVTICYFFRSEPWAAYLSPIVGIITIAIFLGDYIRHVKETARELSDFSIPVAQQDEILDVVLENKGAIKQIKGVNCHRLNNKTYVDILIAFKDQVTYQEQADFLNRVEKGIKEKLPDSIVRLVFENID